MSTATFPPAGDWIRGISIKQPWTTAILTGAKTIENRPQPWSWRGWLLLHAGRQVDRPALRVPMVACTVRGRELTTGAVIGVARLTGCHRDPDGSPPCTPWTQPGAWHLELSDVQALALPIPTRGQLGPWRPTDDLVDQVLQQLPHLRPCPAPEARSPRPSRG
ncbi:hypothetical protein OG890_39645 [Streptomyces anulatus]|uniref:hypothetical protein n=1 Tax=Streptomyces anulatus TaxID=1892 RepID=UPI0022574883|nr:hypothetical protein [Streptomyces anulatus]MCX4490002.1 hypothetical protein [Streptomyces anulatus]